MPANADPTLSIVITNYNYGRFLPVALDSILDQGEDVQIIVVDDCSSDNSREVIAAYSDRVTPVLQDVNQGHGGGFNAGFAKATGDLVMFLDADDFMLPGGIATIKSQYDPRIAIYHYRMRYADDAGALSGIFPPPEAPLADGDLSKRLRETGTYNGTITSGLVFSREFLSRVMPMDSEAYRQGGDGYLSATVPLHGPSVTIETPVSAYRLHGSQHSKFSQAYAKRARWVIGHDHERYKSIRTEAEKLGLPVAEDLAAHHSDHIEQRLISLMFEPSEHPYPDDNRTKLAGQLLDLKQQEGAGGLQAMWWWLIGAAPHALAKRLMRWRIDPNARPEIIGHLGRFMRKRFGILAK